VTLRTPVPGLADSCRSAEMILKQGDNVYEMAMSGCPPYIKEVE
jgi:hypothetical protein